MEKMKARFLVPWFLVLFVGEVSCEFRTDRCEPLDMTYLLNEQAVYYPITYTRFNISTGWAGPFKGAPYVEYKRIELWEHTGTHIDAPAHFTKGGAHVEEIKLSQLMGEGCVIDVTEQTSKNAAYGATVQDIEDWEEENGRLPKDAIVIIRTGWEKYWPHADSYLGYRDKSNPDSMTWPGISSQAAEWLVENRRPQAVGMDSIGIDATGNSPRWGAHIALLNNGIIGVENLANLKPLPARGFTVFLAPIKIDKGSGAPIRAFALGWKGADDPCRRNAQTIMANVLIIICTTLLHFIS